MSIPGAVLSPRSPSLSGTPISHQLGTMGWLLNCMCLFCSPKGLPIRTASHTTWRCPESDVYSCGVYSGSSSLAYPEVRRTERRIYSFRECELFSPHALGCVRSPLRLSGVGATPAGRRPSCFFCARDPLLVGVHHESGPEEAAGISRGLALVLTVCQPVDTSWVYRLR